MGEVSDVFGAVMVTIETQPQDINLSVQNADIAAAPLLALNGLESLNKMAESLWIDKMQVDGSLTRALVSFQANKSKAVYRWFKYKEAFSAGLVEHLLARSCVHGGTILDPFAGIGTALFAAGGMGMRAEGIELLPIGQITTVRFNFYEH